VEVGGQVERAPVLAVGVEHPHGIEAGDAAQGGWKRPARDRLEALDGAGTVARGGHPGNEHRGSGVLEPRTSRLDERPQFLWPIGPVEHLGERNRCLGDVARVPLGDLSEARDRCLASAEAMIDDGSDQVDIGRSAPKRERSVDGLVGGAEPPQSEVDARESEPGAGVARSRPGQIRRQVERGGEISCRQQRLKAITLGRSRHGRTVAGFLVGIACPSRSLGHGSINP
jgi:hypothetical protein